MTAQWPAQNIVRLLRLIQDNPAYRRTLFDTEGYRSTPVWEVTRDLNLAFYKDDRGWREAMRKKGYVEVSNGTVLPTRKWNSRYNDPVKSLVNRLKRELKTWEATYQIDSAWTDFSHVPKAQRRSLKRQCPYYFQLANLVYKRWEVEPPSPAEGTVDAAASSSGNKRKRSASDAAGAQHANINHRGKPVRIIPEMLSRDSSDASSDSSLRTNGSLVEAESQTASNAPNTDSPQVSIPASPPSPDTSYVGSDSEAEFSLEQFKRAKIAESPIALQHPTASGVVQNDSPQISRAGQSPCAMTVDQPRRSEVAAALHRHTTEPVQRCNRSRLSTETRSGLTSACFQPTGTASSGHEARYAPRSTSTFTDHLEPCQSNKASSDCGREPEVNRADIAPKVLQVHAKSSNPRQSGPVSPTRSAVDEVQHNPTSYLEEYGNLESYQGCVCLPDLQQAGLSATWPHTCSSVCMQEMLVRARCHRLHPSWFIGQRSSTSTGGDTHTASMTRCWLFLKVYRQILKEDPQPVLGDFKIFIKPISNAAPVLTDVYEQLRALLLQTGAHICDTEARLHERVTLMTNIVLTPNKRPAATNGRQPAQPLRHIELDPLAMLRRLDKVFCRSRDPVRSWFLNSLGPSPLDVKFDYTDIHRELRSDSLLFARETRPNPRHMLQHELVGYSSDGRFPTRLQWSNIARTRHFLDAYRPLTSLNFCPDMCRHQKLYFDLPDLRAWVIDQTKDFAAIFQKLGGTICESLDDIMSAPNRWDRVAIIELSYKDRDSRWGQREGRMYRRMSIFEYMDEFDRELYHHVRL